MENLAGDVEQLTLQGGKLALKVFKAITIIQEKRSVVVEVLPLFLDFLVRIFSELEATCMSMAKFKISARAFVVMNRKLRNVSLVRS